MVDWAQLRHAYGSAEDIPQLLEALTPDPSDDSWAELWSRVCHQGTIYSASWPVLSELFARAAAWAPEDRPMPLALASAIVASEDGVDESLADMFADVVDRLYQLVVETIACGEFSDDDFVHLLQAAAAFGGDRLWGAHLDKLVDGEFNGACPSCGRDLYLIISPQGFFVTIEEWVNEPRTVRTTITPSALSELSGTARWLHDQATNKGHDVVAKSLEYLFGTANCPGCSAHIAVSTALLANA